MEVSEDWLDGLEGILRDVCAGTGVTACHEDGRAALAMVRQLRREQEPWCREGEVVCGHVVDVAQPFGFRDAEGHWVMREEVRALEPWRFGRQA